MIEFKDLGNITGEFVAKFVFKPYTSGVERLTEAFYI